MHIVTVYPLAKGVRTEQLEYYAPQSVPRGTIISAPFGNRDVKAVVAETAPARKKKTDVRNAEYELRPINHTENTVFFAQFLSAVESFARWSGVTTGNALRALTASDIIESNTDLPSIACDFLVPDVAAPPERIIQAPEKKQLQYIRSLVQNHTSANESVFICAPTIQQCQLLADNLKHQPTFQLHSDATKTATRNRWQKARAETEPIVIVGTPPFLSLPRTDIGRIIVVDESDSAYKMNARPHLDKGRFARHFARSLKQPCTLVDSVLSTSTQWEYREQSLEAEFRPVFRRRHRPETELVDMTELPDTDSSGVRVFAPPAVDILRTAEAQDQHVVLFVARRGRRPFTVCNDCGTVVSCSQCELPLVLSEDDSGERRFVCRLCQQETTSQKQCDNCGGWRLQPLGIGTDFVADILKKNINQIPVFQIDSNTCESREAVQEVRTAFHSAESGVLVTTKLGINHLQSSVSAGVVVTADSLLALPDLTVAHELFSLLLSLRAKSQETFLVQTRSQETNIYQQALAGNITDFYEDQIEKRRQFDYPPFAKLIKLTVDNTSGSAKAKMKEVAKELKTYDPQVYPDRTQNSMHALIRVDRESWVDEKLLAKLRDLPLAVSVNAHPRSLL